MILGDLYSASVYTDESEFIWQSDIEITDPIDYQALTKKKPFSIIIGGEYYNFVVDTRNTSRDDKNIPVLRIHGVSPVALLHTPFFQPRDYMLTLPILAKDAAESILGMPIDWQIENWTIPAYRLSVLSKTPVEMVNIIANACGGILVSKRDGSVLVRYKYPHATNTYDSLVPDHVFTDSGDNLTFSEDNRDCSGTNKFRVRETKGNFSDTIDWIPDEGYTDRGFLKLYPSPYRTNVTVIDTEETVVVLSLIGETTESISETIEFKEGQAGLSKPIIQVSEFKWLTKALGSISYEIDSKSLATDVVVNNGYGLADITYVTHYIEYYVQAPLGVKTMFLVVDLE